VELLVGLVVAGPQDDFGAAAGRGAVRVEAQAGLLTGDGAVGVEVPLLIRLPVALPLK
jgi:hypothetical protein